MPRLDATELQRLEAARVDALYTHLRTAGRHDGKRGLAALTVLHVHRPLSQILASAARGKRLRNSPMEGVQTTPKPRQEEIQVLEDDELARMLKPLRGYTLCMPVLVAASTGMRRGEVLALRWRDLDLERATLQVMQVVEETKEGVRLKEPKTERGRRTIALPARLIEELRVHRKDQAALRFKLGLGRAAHDLVSPTIEDKIRTPRPFSKEFTRDGRGRA